MELLMSVGLLFVSFLFLIWSADRFISAATTVAIYANVPPLIVGMVIVGFGTSAPEFFVSLLATMEHAEGIAFGNVFGSNITNILLGLGLPACVMPLRVSKNILRYQLPLLCFATIVALLFLWNLYFSRIEATIFLVLFVVSMILSAYLENKEPKREQVGSTVFTKETVVWLIVSFVVLVTSSQLLVYSARMIASHLGVSELIIGLTVVAVGTSLPEIVTTAIAVKKGENDLAFGNIIGSNLFNLLFVLGIVGLIRPVHLDQALLYRDGMSMFVAILIVLPFVYRRAQLSRAVGIVLVTLYCLYTIWLIKDALSL